MAIYADRIPPSRSEHLLDKEQTTMSVEKVRHSLRLTGGLPVPLTNQQTYAALAADRNLSISFDVRHCAWL